jgi:UDP-glucose 4-epimerase
LVLFFKKELLAFFPAAQETSPPMASFLVTGGAGFIGSHLADALLAGGHGVRVLDDFSTGKRANLDPRCAVYEADTGDAHALATALEGADGCFHLAAIASVARGNEDWAGTHRVNQTGTIAVLNACREARLPVVYASSAAVYGDLGDAVASESLACAPRTAYGADKLGCELHAAVGWGVHGVPSFGLRFFNVYGPRQDPSSPYSGVISIFADRIARGLPVTLHGDGGQTRDFVYVADVVAHLLAAMERLRAQPGRLVANVCTGRETSVRMLAETLAEITGQRLVLEYGPTRPGDIRRSVGDPTHAVQTLGISADVALPQGLARLVQRP